MKLELVISGANQVENARHPVGNQTKCQHEKEERGRTVLQVLVDFPRHSAQSQQAKHF